MSNEFSSLNGYEVKDAKARQLIAELGGNSVTPAELAEQITALNQRIATLNNAINGLNTRFNNLDIPDTATDIDFDNSTNGMTATNTQKAIEEIKTIAEAVSQGNAEGITYNNTSSGMTATNVQAAIDELKTGAKALNTAYDNTSSGLFATNVQAAIDELKKESTAADTPYNGTASGLAATDAQAAIDEVLSKINIRYNPETDFIQIIDENGDAWDFMEAGIYWNGILLSDGWLNEWAQGITNIPSGNEYNVASYTPLEGSEYGPGIELYVWGGGSVMARINRKVKLGKHSKFSVNFTIENSGEVPGTFGVGFSTNGNLLTPLFTAHADDAFVLAKDYAEGYSQNFSKEFDLSAFSGDENFYYVYIFINLTTDTPEDTSKYLRGGIINFTFE